jgi:sugar transferase (PEP-CTERM system associated)
VTLLGRYVYAPIALLLAAELSSAWVAFTLSEQFFGPSSGPGGGFPLLLSFGFAIAVVMGLTSVGLYQARQRFGIEGVLARILVGVGIAAISVAVIAFVFPIGLDGVLWAASVVGCLVLVALTRIAFWRWWIDHKMFQRRVLVVGAGVRATSLLKLRRRSDRRGFNIVAFLRVPGDADAFVDDRIVNAAHSLPDFARAQGVDEIVVAMDDRRQGFPIGELLSCKFSGVTVIDLVSFLERETGRVKIDLLDPSWLIFSEGFRIKQKPRLGSRVFDFVLGVGLLAVTAPIMAVTALAILLSDGRPVLYKQKRVGLFGRPFTLRKFRTMTTNAEEDGKPKWAQANDARVTRIGQTIRKFRVDELPQLFNVLAGSMSLVGPRPERPEFVENFARRIPYYHERHSVKPGLTGWAQLSYPYGSSYQDAVEKLEYDLYYIKHKGLIFDLMVLLQTAEVVLWRKGAR